MSAAAALPFSQPTRVYWEDTDAGGVVYHASYLRFLERARTDWLRALGLEQAQMKVDLDRLFAIRAMQIDFRQPARLDDLLQVRIESVTVGRASLDFVQTIQRPSSGASGLLVEATVRAACLVGSTFKPAAIPDSLRARLIACC